jgi:hypothetical protein
MRALCYCMRCWVVLSIPALYVKGGAYDSSVHLHCPGCAEIHGDFVLTTEGKS